MQGLPPEIRLQIYELLLPPGPWNLVQYRMHTFHDFFKLYHINKEIRSEAQQLTNKIMQKIVFDVRLDGFDQPQPLPCPWRPFDISVIKVLRIEIPSGALGKLLEDRPIESEHGDPEKFYWEQDLVADAKQVMTVVNDLHSATSLTQLSVTFVVNRLENDYHKVNTLSILKTLADPFKALRGINQPKLVGIGSFGNFWTVENAFPLDTEEFYQYKTGWEKALGRVEDSPGLSNVESMYYRLLLSFDDISMEMERLELDEPGCGCGWCTMVFDSDDFGDYQKTVSYVLGQARLARDGKYALQRLEELRVEFLQPLLKKINDRTQEWIREQNEEIENKDCERQKHGPDFFIV